MAYAYATPVTSTVKMNIGLDANGNISQAASDTTASKTFSIPGLKAAATLAESNAVFDAIIGNIAKGTFDSLSATKTITVGVVETE